MQLKISEGLSDIQKQELVNYSISDILIISTTNDSSRFGTIPAVNKWLEKDRKIYTLTDENDKLVGILWFGEKPISTKTKNKKYSKYGITFAIRIYGAARGKGHSEKFFNHAFSLYKETTEYKNNNSNGIWLVTDHDNKAAIKLYTKVGFKKIEKVKENKILMIL